MGFFTDVIGVLIFFLIRKPVHPMRWLQQDVITMINGVHLAVVKGQGCTSQGCQQAYQGCELMV